MRYSRLADRALRRALPALLLSFFLITAAISRAQEPADPATPDPAAEQTDDAQPADTADAPADTADAPADTADEPAADTATDDAAADTAAAETEAVKSVKLDEAMDSLAAEVVKYFKAEGEPSIIVGPFTGPPGTSAGPRIVKQLKDKITGKLEVVEANACGVSGKYKGTKDEASGKFVIIVSAEVCDRLGEQTRRLTKRIITSEEEGLTLMGATAALPLKTAASGASTPTAAGSTPLQEARADAIVESVNNPQVEVSGAIIKADDESPYGLEVLVMTPKGFVPLPVTAEDGVAHVDVKPGQSYAVRLINNSPEPAGVALTIDGINVLAFSQNYKEIGKWVLPAKSRGLIEGWHDVGPRFLSFVVTEYGKSAAAKLCSVDNVGTITAIFTSAFTKTPPKDEPLEESLDRDQSATGIGPPVERKVRTLPTSFGAVRAAVSVRYTKPDLSDLPRE